MENRRGRFNDDNDDQKAEEVGWRGAKRPRKKGADDVEMMDRRGENSGNTSISGQIIAWISD